jgi:hypothetical protein
MSGKAQPAASPHNTRILRNVFTRVLSFRHQGWALGPRL